MKQRVSAVVLVVEDDADLRTELCRAIHGAGYPAVGARDGADAVAYLSSGAPTPSLILLDLNMRPLDGWGFHEWLRGNPAFSQVPVVLMSAHPELEAVAHDLGAASTLRKPFTPATAVAHVQRLCG